MRLKDGCPGCSRTWRDGEGQCSRCKRCLSCCGKATVAHSCEAKYAALKPGAKGRSDVAYDRWLNNSNILGHNRRIT